MAGAPSRLSGLAIFSPPRQARIERGREREERGERGRERKKERERASERERESGSEIQLETDSGPADALFIHITHKIIKYYYCDGGSRVTCSAVAGPAGRIFAAKVTAPHSV
jgi:hypothetical protein